MFIFVFIRKKNQSFQLKIQYTDSFYIQKLKIFILFILIEKLKIRVLCYFDFFFYCHFNLHWEFLIGRSRTTVFCDWLVLFDISEGFALVRYTKYTKGSAGKSIIGKWLRVDFPLGAILLNAADQRETLSVPPNSSSLSRVLSSFR